MKCLALGYIIGGSILMGLGFRNIFIGLAAFAFGIAALALKIDKS